MDAGYSLYDIDVDVDVEMMYELRQLPLSPLLKYDHHSNCTQCTVVLLLFNLLLYSTSTSVLSYWALMS